MWRCQRCQETLEDAFDLCWKCGTSRAGEVDSGFRPEPEDPAIPDPGPEGHENSAGATADSRPGPGSGMDRREIAALICRTLALLMFSQAAFLGVVSVLLMCLTLLTMPFRRWCDCDELYANLILCIPFFATLVVGLIYWKKSNVIASRMVSDDPEPVISYRITVQDVMVVAFSTAGVLILVDCIRDFVPMAYLAFRYENTAAEFWYNTRTWSVLIQSGLALWLMLGSTGIVRAVRWLRTAGVTPTESQMEREST